MTPSRAACATASVRPAASSLSNRRRIWRQGRIRTLVRRGKYGCATHREKGTCTNASQISVSQLEGRVLAGIEKGLLDSELVGEFVHEFHSEVMRLRAVSTEVGSYSKKKLAEIQQKITRIVNAIAEGTDTPALRQTLISSS